MSTPLIILLITIPLIVLLNYLTVVRKSYDKNGHVVLKAKKNHNNRGLSFSKGNFYNFYKNGDFLLISEDDNCRDRDNYRFYKEDLDIGFTHTSLYTKLVLQKIRKYIY